LCVETKGTMKMNSTKRANSRRIVSRRATTPQDPWLIFHLQLFNYAGGWSQLLLRHQKDYVSR
jgi:hypothetical protein